MTDTEDHATSGHPTLSRPQVEDVFAATESVRASRFPFVPKELLAVVLATEQEHLDDRLAGQRAVARAVDTWLADHQDVGNG